MNRIETATHELRDQLLSEQADPEKIVGPIRDCQRCLEEIGVVPEAVRNVIRQVEHEGGAAKISGDCDSSRFRSVSSTLMLRS